MVPRVVGSSPISHPKVLSFLAGLFYLIQVLPYFIEHRNQLEIGYAIKFFKYLIRSCVLSVGQKPLSTVDAKIPTDKAHYCLLVLFLHL